MHVSQKCQYTLRALFELAKRGGSTPTAAAEIAQAQAIPPRFLELILQGLRAEGMIASRRGNQGGYVLNAPPESISVGDIIRVVPGHPTHMPSAAGYDRNLRPRTPATARSGNRTGRV